MATRKDMWMLARKLAEAIGESPELAAYRQTEEQLLADAEAVALIREYEAAKRAVKQSKDRPPAEQLHLVDRFMTIEERFNAHTAIQAYWRARTNLDALLEKINAVITFPITGAEAPRRNSGCGSGGCGCS